MKFEDAIKAIREGKNVRIKGDDYFLTMIAKMYYDNNPDRPVEILSVEHHILSEDWEIVE